MADLKGRDTLRTEIRKGGSEAPCPFCGVPRVRRTDYIRCCRCGINWLRDEPLDRDPRNERMRRLVEGSNLGVTNKVKREEEHAGR
jgi:hypothetical protein